MHKLIRKRMDSKKPNNSKFFTVSKNNLINPVISKKIATDNN